VRCEGSTGYLMDSLWHGVQTQSPRLAMACSPYQSLCWGPARRLRRGAAYMIRGVAYMLTQK